MGYFYGVFVTHQVSLIAYGCQATLHLGILKYNSIDVQSQVVCVRYLTANGDIGFIMVV